MKYRFHNFFILLILVFSHAVLTAQCEPPPVTICEKAYTLVAEDFVGGYHCSTPDIENAEPSSICGFNNITDNATFLSFIPKTPFLDFEFFPSNCVGGESGDETYYGIQAAISDDCSFTNPIICFIACNTVSATPFVLGSEEFIVGKEYFLLIDGCSGDLCDYSIFLTNGTIGCDTIGFTYPKYSPDLDSLDTFCAGIDSLTFEAPNSNAIDFKWMLDGDLVSTNEYYKHPLEIPGSFELCLKLINACDTTEYYCDQFSIEFGIDSLTIPLCRGDIYQLDTFSFDTAGIYDILAPDDEGCLTEFNITIEELLHSSSELNLTICNGAVAFVAGEAFFHEGSYEITTTASNGCDSTIFLELITLDTFYSSQSFDICIGDSVIVGNSVYFETGIYTDTFSVNGGCDSIVTSGISVNEFLFTQFNNEICEGDSALFQNEFYFESGTYLDTISSSFGCDSILSFALEVHPITDTIIKFEICEGDSLFYELDTLTHPGFYYYDYQSQFGCDSLVQLDLVIFNSPETELHESICDGDSLEFAGIFIDSAGIYIDSLISVDGCDSIEILTLTLLPRLDTFLEREICSGDTILVAGFPLSNQGLYNITLTSSLGCDSLITVDLKTQNIPELGILNTMICLGDSISFNDQILYEEGTYYDTTSVGACDSITMLNLAFYPPTSIDTIITHDTGKGNGSINVATQSDSTQFSFLWSTGDTIPFIDSLVHGGYMLTITDSLGCETVFAFDVNFVSSNQVQIEKNFSFFPNPSNGHIHYVNNVAEEIQIFSLDGKIQYRADLSENGNLKTNLLPGIYIYRTYSKTNVLSIGRLVIQ